MFREPEGFAVHPDINTPEMETRFSIEDALEAYRHQKLALRFAGNKGMEYLSEDLFKAERQIKSLLSQGYKLRQDTQGSFYLSRGLLGGMMTETPIAALEKKLDMKPEGKLSVFITYQWAQKEIAIAVHKAFEAKGFLVIRDEDTLHNGVYIQDFMKIITHPKLDYVLPVISASYLKSKNCMYEVNQIMKRHHWESSLLPYVVTEDSLANAHIYSGVASYEDYWQEQLTQPEGVRNRQLFENILRNIRPFTTAITTRIQIPEGELIASGYQALFETVSQREAAREGVRFREIEELLRIASFDEKMEEHDEVKKSFENAIAKLKAMKAVHGIDNISAKVYGLYGEYLLREDNQKDGEKYLRIAKKFGFKPTDTSDISNVDVARLSLEPSSSSPANVVIAQQEKAELELKQKAEAEAKLKIEQEANLKAEVERKRQEQELKLKQEAELKLKQEAKLKEEAETKRKAEEAKAKELLAKQEKERLEKERLDNERKLKEEAERKRLAEEQRKVEEARKIQEAKLKAEAELKQKAEVVASPILLSGGPKPSPSSVSQVEVEKFLRLVVEGEQDQAEAMIKKNPDLLLARGTVNDLAGRIFTGVDPEIVKRGGNGVREFKDITAFQYAVWALDCHMWKMLLKHLPTEQARLQAQQFETGSWVRLHGVHAGSQLQELIKALKTYIDNYDPWTGEQCRTHWTRQVGGAQLLLPTHVINEYCHPTRSFDPCPKFEAEGLLPRTRKVTIDKEYEDMFKAQWNGGSLGNSFGLVRRRAAAATPACGEGVGAVDHRSITALCSTRTQQRDRLITELGNSSTLDNTRRSTAGI